MKGVAAHHPSFDASRRRPVSLEQRIFFFNDAAPNEIYTSLHTLSLHDALPIWSGTIRPRNSACGTVWSTMRWRSSSFENSLMRQRRSEEHTSELQSRNDIS